MPQYSEYGSIGGVDLLYGEKCIEVGGERDYISHPRVVSGLGHVTLRLLTGLNNVNR